LKQSDLETEMSTLGVSRYRSRVSKTRSAKLESCSTAGQRVLEKSVQELTKGLERWMHEASRAAGRKHRVLPLIKKLPTQIVSMITCRAVIDGIASIRTINSLSSQIGRLIEDEYRFRQMRKNHPRWWSKMMKLVSRQPGEESRRKFIKKSSKLHGMTLPSWSPKDRVAVGLVCVELMRQNTGIIEIVNRTNIWGKDMTIVRASDDFMVWLEKSHAAAEMMAPVYMPMIIAPCDWESVWAGGYLGVAFGRRPLVKATSKSYLQTLDKVAMPEVYSAVNNIQSTAWKINSPVLDVIKQAWDRGLVIGDMPARDSFPIPSKPVDIDTDPEARRQWRKTAARVHFENECARSKRIAVSKTIWLADKYGNATMYYPQELDFRGRVYPKPIFLNNQGADWQRSMLTFAVGKKIDSDSMGWLAIHGANMFGMDKVSFADRVKFIQDNHGLIMQIGKDPWSENWWTKADKPWGFLAFCIEWYKVNTDPNYESSLPVHLDGSNNGLQIFSLMLRDPIGAAATNCTPTDTPRDIYQDVADRVIQKMAAAGGMLDAQWLAFGIDRKTTKRVVMCLPYGLTKYSSKQYVRDWYLDKARSTGNRPFEKDSVWDAVTYLTDVVWQAINEIVVAAVGAMDWLKQCARVHVEAGVPIRWSSPCGFLVQQDYKKLSRVVVKTSVGSVLRQHRILVDGTDLSMSRNVNAISPNVVHSIDAAILMRTVNLAKSSGVNSFSCIHDSFGVPAADAGTISTAIRQVSCEIFSQPILKSLQSEMQAYLPKGYTLTDPPEMGTLDVSSLMGADYFFA
jgi:DNA-directed RNA polymerase